MKRILIIVGHPNNDSFCGALAESYRRGAEAAGAETRLLRLAELKFDPVLHRGYGEVQELEPDLVRAQSDIAWAEHLVVVFPVWWGTMPALLKGFLDRTLLPGFAFKYRKDSPFWDRLLAGRSARMIVTLDAPVLYNLIVNRNSAQNAMKRSILRFCGFKPVRTTSIGSVRNLNEERIETWLAKAEKLGRELK